jgi:hypothetical protein
VKTLGRKKEGGMTTGEEGTQREDQAAQGQPPAQDQAAQGQPPAQDQPQTSPPYNMYVVLAALVLVTVLAALVLLFYRSVFTEATDVTSLLATLFSVIGTVVSAYFGVKSTNDTTDKAIGQVEKEAKRTEAAHQAAREPSRG